MQVHVEAHLKCLWLQSFSEFGKKNSLAHIFAEDKKGSGFAIVAEWGLEPILKSPVMLLLHGDAG